MYGLLFECFENFVTSHYSRAAWVLIVSKAFLAFKEQQTGVEVETGHLHQEKNVVPATGEESGKPNVRYSDVTEERYAAEGWLSNCSYPDSLFSCLCAATMDEVDIQSEEIIRGCGFYFLDFMR